MTCTKREFKSFDVAEKVAIELSLQNKQIGHPELSPYKCNICKKYHLTSRSGKTEKEKQIMKKEREFILRESKHWINKFDKN